MPKIKLTPDTLREKAGELNVCMEDQRKVISDVASLINNLVSDWQGKAQEAFIAAFEDVKPIYDKFADPDMTSFIGFLNNYANTMEDLDVGHSTKASGLTTGTGA